MMKRLLPLLLLVPGAVMAQSAPPANVQMANGQPRSVTPVACLDGTGAWISCGGSGTGGGTSDATAANQQAQLTQEQLTAARLGDTASPGTGSVNARLNTINTTLGSVATSANQTSMLAKMPALGTAGTPSADVITVQGTANGTPQPVLSKGGSSLVTGQVSVGTTSTLVAAARTGRQKIVVTLGAANDCYFGPTGVTSTTGFRVKGVDGAQLTLDTSAALYAVCVATTTVSYGELF